MPIYARILQLLAGRSQKRGNDKHALYWYDKLGEQRMQPPILANYALLLQRQGMLDRSLAVLSRWIALAPSATAYERRARIYQETGKLEQAINDLDDAIVFDPSSYTLWYIRAIVKADQGLEEAAAADLEQSLLRADPEATTLVSYELGNMYMRMDQYEKAITAYQSAAAQPEQVVPLLQFRLGEALIGALRLEEALTQISFAAEEQARLNRQPDKGLQYYRSRMSYSLEGVRNALSQVEGEYGFRLKQSKLFEQLERWDDAMAAVEQGLADYPEAEDLLIRKGALLRDAGRSEEAIQQFDLVIDRYSERLSGYMEKCAVYRRKGEWMQAIEVMEEAKRRFPDHTVIRFWHIDVLREAEQSEAAWAGSLELTDMEPEDPLNWKQQAELAIDTARFDHADEAYTRALELDLNANYHMRRSFSRFMSDRYEDAFMDVQAAIALDPALQQESKTAYALGELYMGMNNQELAEAEFGRAIALEPGNAVLFERRARCRASMNRLEDALADCNEGIALNTSPERLLRLRGMLRYRMGDYEGALQDCNVYLAALPQEAEGYFNLGAVLAKLDRNDEALAAFSRSIELSPFDGQVYLERASLYYHRMFDRIQAADDLAQWLIYTVEGHNDDDRLAALADLEGFDDELRELARAQYLRQYGADSSLPGHYLS